MRRARWGNPAMPSTSGGAIICKASSWLDAIVLHARHVQQLNWLNYQIRPTQARMASRQDMLRIGEQQRAA